MLSISVGQGSRVPAATEGNTIARRWIPSVQAAWVALGASRQLVALPFCVANKLLAVCVSLGPGAAVPWNLYRLKIAETQSALTNHFLSHRLLHLPFCSPLRVARERRPVCVHSLLENASWQLRTAGSRRAHRIIIGFWRD
jgi:hypothetical protein